MAGKRRKLVEVGTVFPIAIGDLGYAICQVIGKEGRILYVVCYDAKHATPGISELRLTADKIILIGKTFDIFFDLGTWSSLGVMPVPAGIRYPAYRLSGMSERGEEEQIVDFWIKHYLRGMKEIAVKLPRSSTVSCALFEAIVRAYYGIAPSYDIAENVSKFRPPAPGLSSNELFGLTD